MQTRRPRPTHGVTGATPLAEAPLTVEGVAKALDRLRDLGDLPFLDRREDRQRAAVVREGSASGRLPRPSPSSA